MKTNQRRLILLLVRGGIFGWVWAVCGQAVLTCREIDPPDVFAHLELMRNELNLIRFVMGQPKVEQPEIRVDGAAPREVYFQSLTIFRKAERLCFEHTREHEVEPELPAGEIRPQDVYDVIDKALECVRRVKDKLNILEQSQPLTRDPAKTPTDVFRSAVQANRQLNQLLERRFAPSDVFQQVTLGVGYASRLLEQFPDATPIPDAPEFVVGKRPSDVYRRLLTCFERIRKIAETSGLEMLEFEADESRIAKAGPSDVYDIASLLVSELAFLHAQIPNIQPARDVHYVGRKFPSHVYQRAGILERQLIELEKWVEQQPGWLIKQETPQ